MTREEARVNTGFVDRDGYHTDLRAVPGNEPHLVLYRIRSSDFPYEVRQGYIQPLDGSIQGLAEPTHFLLAAGNLVVSIGSGHSPRPTRLAAYLRERLGWDVWLKPVLRHDAASILLGMETVANVELAIPASDAESLDFTEEFTESGNPGAVLRTAGAASGGGDVYVKWMVGRGTHADQGRMKRLVRWLSRNDLARFKVARTNVYLTGESKQYPVDFIQQKLVATVDVGEQHGRSRDITAEGAISGMKHALDVFQTAERGTALAVDPTQDLAVPDQMRGAEQEFAQV